MSLPSRERGLKLKYGVKTLPTRGSLPSRERGLKYSKPACRNNPNRVAPFTGAWIEIHLPWHKALVLSSLPSRERGLKYDFP